MHAEENDVRLGFELELRISMYVQLIAIASVCSLKRWEAIWRSKDNQFPNDSSFYVLVL